MMNIHLSKPGGQREGPFSLEQINADLAAHKYHDSDYWAWYEGLNEWVPLHQVPGVIRSPTVEPQELPAEEPEPGAAGDTEVLYREEPNQSEEPTLTEEPIVSEETALQEELPPSGESALQEETTSEDQSEAMPQDESVTQETTPVEEPGAQDESVLEEETAPQGTETEEEAVPPGEVASEEPGSQEWSISEDNATTQDAAPPEEVIPQENAPPQEFPLQPEETVPTGEAPPSLSHQLYSGMPLEALEQVLLLSSGDAQNASRSAITTGMLEAAIGADLDVIREKIRRDAMGGCAFLEKLREGGGIADAALRAAAQIKPDLVRQAREGLYRICVRTFPIETGEMVALFLFYNKQML